MGPNLVPCVANNRRITASHGSFLRRRKAQQLRSSCAHFQRPEGRSWPPETSCYLELTALVLCVSVNRLSYMSPEPPGQSARGNQWASTMGGYPSEIPGVRLAHAAAGSPVGDFEIMGRVAREEFEDSVLAPGATRADGGGDRLREEEPDELRTCFERDRD